MLTSLRVEGELGQSSQVRRRLEEYVRRRNGTETERVHYKVRNTNALRMVSQKQELLTGPKMLLDSHNIQGLDYEQIFWVNSAFLLGHLITVCTKLQSK